jgi:hypothetical protein
MRLDEQARKKLEVRYDGRQFQKNLKGETAGLDEDKRENTAARWRFSP